MMEVLGLTKSLIAHLRGKIIRGELAPGERINEASLLMTWASAVLRYGKLYGSLRRNTYYQHSEKGSIVTNVSIEDLEELYEMRDMIECYALDILREKGEGWPSHCSHR
jgi:DNA-binding GntR family transcriptional regulator